MLFCVLFLWCDTTNKNTSAQALYTFYTPNTNFTFEQGANTNDNDNNNNNNNLNPIDHQRTATQDSMSNTEDSFRTNYIF